MSTKNNALLALTAAATALPGVAANAQQIAENVEIGYRYHKYDEDPIDANKVFGEATERYDIDVNQFKLIAPLSDNVQLDFDYQTEQMSGASPWLTVLSAEGEVVQVLTGASIEEKRTDVATKMSYFFDRQVIGVGVAHSDENDYESLAFSANYAFETEDRLNTFGVAADVSNDDINPSDPDIYPERPATEQSKRSSSVLFSYTRVLNKQLVAKFSLGYAEKTGYLDDPYKQTLVAFNLVGDSRPDTRYSTTLSTQLRYFNDTLNGALHVDYRYYDDSWDIRSNTIKLSWYQNLPWDIQVIPSVRLYDQSEAFFYQIFYPETPANGYYSTDYRLSEYGAITYGLTLNKTIDHFTFSIAAETYRSGGSKGFASAESENPGLLDFDLISVGVNYRF